ncbi:hypothetical protein [Streptomyces sp. NPDC003023]|uniref:hypothetical protein n=1 Tax=Streptomyces sp. NPDC003023 TaxID=3364675 RepID=UPI00368A5391
MLQQREAGSVRMGRDPVVRPALPDLTGVDLHTLHAMDEDAALCAAVEQVLACPGSLTEAWADGT